MQNFIPRNYPRTVREETETVGTKIAVAFGVLAAFTTLVTVVMTYRQRKRKVFQYAQVEFVFLLLLGLLLVSAAGLITAIPPTDFRCVTIAWLLNIGYTFELVPLVVKIAAINRLFQAARRMQRVKLSRGLLLGVVAALTSVVVLYMIVWTIVDPPSKEGQYTLTDGTTKKGHSVVMVSYICAAESQAWMLVAVGCQSLLLLCASILAFMTRKMRKDINDSNTISFLIYWNFVCVLIRFILILVADRIDVTKTNLSNSLIFSADSFVTILIYFLPKFQQTETSNSLSRSYSSQQFVNVDVHAMFRSGTDDNPSQTSGHTNIQSRHMPRSDPNIVSSPTRNSVETFADDVDDADEAFTKADLTTDEPNDSESMDVISDKSPPLVRFVDNVTVGANELTSESNENPPEISDRDESVLMAKNFVDV